MSRLIPSCFTECGRHFLLQESFYDTQSNKNLSKSLYIPERIVMLSQSKGVLVESQFQFAVMPQFVNFVC